jgi:hypothetical protein
VPLIRNQQSAVILIADFELDGARILAAGKLSDFSLPFHALRAAP